MRKIRFLIVSGSLAQAGNERWIYEICKAMNKETFEVGVLCGKKYLKIEKDQNFGNYYYHELKKLGVRLYEYLDDKPKSDPISRIVYRSMRLARHLIGKPKTKTSKQIVSLLKESDVICLIDFYNYSPLKDVIHKCCEGRFFIVLHSHKVQFDYDPYYWFEKDLIYRFTYCCPKQVTEIESSGLSLEKNDFFFAPLVLDLSDYPNLFNPIKNKTLIFSIFTRIAWTKSIDVFITAFAKLREQLSYECVLNVYGEIQDEQYHQQLQQLMSEQGLNTHSVRFMGHSLDMAESITQDGVNIYWGIAMNASCSYSSIEIGALGVPCFFWNQDAITDYRTILEQTGNSMIAHNDIRNFVADNIRFATDDGLLSELSARQRRFFTERHDISNKIKDFESYIAAIAATNPRG